ncbi:hypothetical protein B484DRAFT_403989 [Ochromonadaceae sp. CCMP2298]|nr:hypothetical protein B484DRAFT_403989 [Ochromonadaceae sp. CCMP2298]
MSWLNSAKRWAKEGIMHASGSHQATEDIEFDLKLRQFTRHVHDMEKVNAAMEIWLESLDAFTASTALLGETFKDFFNDSPYAGQGSPYAAAAESFAEVAEKINTGLMPSVRQLFVARCLRPAGAVLALAAPIDEQIKARNDALVDFDFYRAKIEKEHAQGRNSEHPKVMKRAAQLDDAAMRLYSLKLGICASFDEFTRARPVTLGPEFCSFLACHHHCSSYSSELTAAILPSLPQVSSSLYALESVLDADFAEVSSLPQVPLLVERRQFAGGGWGGYGTSSSGAGTEDGPEAGVSVVRASEGGSAPPISTVPSASSDSAGPSAWHQSAIPAVSADSHVTDGFESEGTSTSDRSAITKPPKPPKRPANLSSAP